MQNGEAQVVRGRLVTGPQRPLRRTSTWAGGWGLQRVTDATAWKRPPQFQPPQLRPQAAQQAAPAEQAEQGIDDDVLPPLSLWQRLAVSRVALGVAMFALVLVAAALWSGRSGKPTATAGEATAPAVAPAMPAAAQPAAVPPPSPAAPAQRAVAAQPPPAVAPAQRPVAGQPPREVAAPVAAPARPLVPVAPTAAQPVRPAAPAKAQRPARAVAPRPAAAQRARSAAAKAAPQPGDKEWVDPFGDGSWVDLPAGTR